MLNPDPESVLTSYRVNSTSLYVVGTFDSGVTVLSQQIRALNLAWAAIESDLVPSRLSDPKSGQLKIAVVGGGFAGLTFVAGLRRKGARADVTILEQRDTLLPLQQGSDSRWLHPRIYEWPAEGTDSHAAMLPVMNWTAARASDVVVQIMAAWAKVVDEAEASFKLNLYCNARYLQISKGTAGSQLHLDWVGELRDARDGRPESGGSTSAQGEAADFDIVILTTGFGAERGEGQSYWRNETFGQPSLGESKHTYLISGQGDGAMVDLMRLRISQFRQDRILSELFRNRSVLLSALKELHKDIESSSGTQNIFNRLEALADDPRTREDFESVRQELARRLRRDTDVVLHLKVSEISRLFDPTVVRVSFQNRVLVYFLYKCGAFIPATLSEDKLATRYAIPEARRILRQGPLRLEQFDAFLSEPLREVLTKQAKTDKPTPLKQGDKEHWPGGYFGYPGSTSQSLALGDEERVHWRKEYLPGPTELLATAFCGSLAGKLNAGFPASKRLRVTLHRTVMFGKDPLLQQTCDYFGTGNRPDATAARTYPPSIGTIGLAYESQKIVRSVKGITPVALKEAMQKVHLQKASRNMAADVGFVLAIPLLQPVEPRTFYAPSPVFGVVYIDSTAENYFIGQETLECLVSMTKEFLLGLARLEIKPFERIVNVPLSGLSDLAVKPKPLPDSIVGIVEIVTTVDPPRTTKGFQLNYDYSDFLPSTGGAPNETN